MFSARGQRCRSWRAESRVEREDGDEGARVVASPCLLPVVAGHLFDLVLYRLYHGFLSPSPDARTHAMSRG